MTDIDLPPINKGECLHQQLTFDDEGGPINLTGRTLSVLESYPPDLGATFNVTDAANGVAEMHIGPADAAKLRPGRVNWFRLAMSLPGEHVETSPRIWITVQ